MNIEELKPGDLIWIEFGDGISRGVYIGNGLAKPKRYPIVSLEKRWWAHRTKWSLRWSKDIIEKK